MEVLGTTADDVMGVAVDMVDGGGAGGDGAISVGDVSPQLVLLFCIAWLEERLVREAKTNVSV